jgi:hypothetical protein
MDDKQPLLKIEENNQEGVTLTRQEGSAIKGLIHIRTGLKQVEYAKKIDMNETLLSRYLNGQAPLTRQSLNRILSGLTITETIEGNTVTNKLVASWQTTITVHQSVTGPAVRNADFTTHEET